MAQRYHLNSTPTNTKAPLPELLLTLDSNSPFQRRVEGDAWLLSYLDVFLLIIALLVILLVQPPNSVTLPDSAEFPVSGMEDIPTAHQPQEDKNKPSPLDSVLKTLSSDYRINVVSNGSRISVRLDEALLFDSSKAVIKPKGKLAIQQLIPVLKELGRPLVIEGHTDNTPISTSLYPSNWELSAARANSVLHYLSSQGMPKSLMSTANYADTRPLVSNNTETNRGINRRVNLLILLNEG
ncbi:OmpA/MotB family protein [Alkalimarinus coralli]|uniref:OmpA/MotB family protein n=1 Tax=Alkalimarinus coralli TaxID=2935863 RepID=UPI00202B1601|nr:flagellar motor protein MotB [Alkalimarinus coralli]